MFPICFQYVSNVFPMSLQNCHSIHPISLGFLRTFEFSIFAVKNSTVGRLRVLSSSFACRTLIPNPRFLYHFCKSRTPSMHTAGSTSSWVCFPCRAHRNISRNFSCWGLQPKNPPPHHCGTYLGEMVHIGHKMHIPPTTDDREWRELYDQVTSPGYWNGGLCKGVDEARHIENEHWKECRVRQRWGAEECETCKRVTSRMSEAEKERWWKRVRVDGKLVH